MRRPVLLLHRRSFVGNLQHRHVPLPRRPASANLHQFVGIGVADDDDAWEKTLLKLTRPRSRSKLGAPSSITISPQSCMLSDHIQYPELPHGGASHWRRTRNHVEHPELHQRRLRANNVSINSIVVFSTSISFNVISIIIIIIIISINIVVVCRKWPRSFVHGALGCGLTRLIPWCLGRSVRAGPEIIRVQDGLGRHPPVRGMG